MRVLYEIFTASLFQKVGIGDMKNQDRNFYASTWYVEVNKSQICKHYHYIMIPVVIILTINV